ncbi:MAG: hypothetical protein JJE03_03000 [Peptostreptococcaceae bacterium]|nr:hypothetical protein [Peptostreptococcaceae bacterium]
MLKINVNEDVAYIEIGDTDPETTLAELQVASEGVLKDVSNLTKQPYNELIKFFTNVME